MIDLGANLRGHIDALGGLFRAACKIEEEALRFGLMAAILNRIRIMCVNPASCFAVTGEQEGVPVTDWSRQTGDDVGAKSEGL